MLPMRMPTRQKSTLGAATMNAAVAVAIGIGLSGCASPQPTLKPCGVIRDSLVDVKATDDAGERRLAVHYERGRAAGCWK